MPMYYLRCAADGWIKEATYRLTAKHILLALFKLSVACGFTVTHSFIVASKFFKSEAKGKGMEEKGRGGRKGEGEGGKGKEREESGRGREALCPHWPHLRI